MISRTASKLVLYSGRNGKSFSGAALAANEKSNEIESDRDSSANDVNHDRRKTINKAQRRAVIEEFVNEYKAMNGGKLPPTSTVKKHSGGSYYTVKSILQEIEYRSKLPSFDQTVKEDESSSEAIKVSESKTSLSERHDEADKDFQSSTSSEASFSKQVLYRDDCSGSAEAQCSHVEEGDKAIIDSRFNTPGTDKDETVFTDNGTKPTNALDEQFEDTQKDICGTINLDSHEIPSFKLYPDRVLLEDFDDVEESKKGKDFAEDQHKKQDNLKEPANLNVEAAEDPKKSTLWGNIKSFADGFMKIWRS